ncbi:MAG: carboxypeptidase-like regulatory domain-containing protein [Acidobacteriota bacterium]
MLRWFNLFTLSLLLTSPAVLAQAEQPEGSATVSGRITNEKDEPVSGTRVYMRKLPAGVGDDPLQRMPETASDSEGFYSFKNVPEGDYQVFVVRLPNDSTGNSAPVTYYFPGVPSPVEAQNIRVGPNAVLTAIDIRFTTESSGYQARGRAVDAETGAPAANIKLIHGLDTNLVRDIRVYNYDLRTDTDGSFLLKGLAPGKYWLALYHGDSGEYYSRPVYFQINDSDVKNLELQVHKGVSLSGIVILDDGIPKEILNEARIAFRPQGISETGRHPANQLIDQQLIKSGRVQSNGVFTIEGVPPVTGDLSFERQIGMPFQNYVVLIEHNERNIARSLRVQETDIDKIYVIVTGGNGALSGTVRCTGGILDMTRLRITLVLQNDNSDFYSKNVPLESDGRFKTEQLLPGRYLVMVVYSSPEGLSWRLGPNFYADVRNNTLSTIDLPVPAPQSQTIR